MATIVVARRLGRAVNRRHLWTKAPGDRISTAPDPAPHPNNNLGTSWELGAGDPESYDVPAHRLRDVMGIGGGAPRKL